MGTNYSEQIFQSIDTIISQRLNEVSFDKTEICEVISQDKNDKRKYLVSNGSLKYEAYSDDENRSYLNNQKVQKVYVRITNGDYSLRKIITGSYAADETNENLYVNPFNHLVISEQHHCIMESNKLSATAYLDNTKDEDSYIINDLTFYQSGFDNFTYIGLDFSMSTGFGGTTGEFLIIIDLLDNNGVSLLTDKELGLVTLSSKQLYGNPYYLNDKLRFQHLFNFPIGNFSDLTQVKKIKITLVTKGKFNYLDNNSEYTIDDLSEVILNDLIIYFGFKSSIEKMSKNDVKLVLDNTELLEYTTIDDKKQMSIDWRDLETNAIYNETSNMQYPKFGKYNIYWLQYSESIGFTKRLETTPVDEQEEGIDYIDIAESGTYWKTVKRTDASFANAYIYTLFPATDWKKEQIKVIIKNIETNEYIESNGLTFINTEFQLETGSNEGKQDTLKLTLAEGDDGIYNNYGIDNKLLGTYDLAHSLTVNYVDNTKWDWNPEIQKVIWKIPAKATMIRQPGDGWRLENNFYVYDSNPDLQTINFNLSYQFSYNKTNNTIYCNIIRYKDKNRDIITDEYQGSITLQFGLQYTAGTGWAFNIIQSQRALSYPNDTMTLTATFENENGEPISLDSWKDKVKWEWHQSSNDSYILEQETDNKHQAIIKRSDGDYDPYAIVKATLVDWQDSNGQKVNLEAYLPIATGSSSYYLTGASRVVYNNTGNTPIYDEEAYGLYNQETHNLVSADYTYAIISSESNLNKIFAINKEEGNLKPLNLLPTQIPKMSLVVKEPSGTIMYAQPILVLRNGYQSKLLNEWDGSLKIDTENNSIFSALMGAGIKNSDNTFTGVLMGAVGETLSTAKTGIYGVQSGELRYKLDEKGDFYVGTGSDNKIDFSGPADGDKTLTIEAKNFKLTTSKLTIDSNNGIKLLDSNGNITIQILNNGTATIGGWAIEQDYLGHQGASNETVFLSYTGMKPDNTLEKNKTFYLFIKNKFGVDTDGSMYATGGKLGTWTLDVNVIKSGKIGEDNSAFMCTGTEGDFEICGHKGKGWVFGAGKNFGVTKSGDLYANSGYIGGWHITSNSIESYTTIDGDNKLYWVSMWSNYPTWGHFLLCRSYNDGIKGGTDYDDYFDLRADGTLIAKNATITGTINANNGTFKTDIIIGDRSISNWITEGGYIKEIKATTGTIGGWEIDSTAIHGRDSSGYGIRLQQDKLYVTSSNRTFSTSWYSIYSAGAATSDARLKHDIKDIDEQYDILFNKLSAKTFCYNVEAEKGNPEDIHFGFVAQDILKIQNELNLNNLSFVFNEQYYGIRITEFIALNTWQIQKLKTRVTELENEIKEIKQRYEI